MRANIIVEKMKLEEKAALCSGFDFWNTKGMERFSLKSIMLTDGPHGLRKQAGDADHLGINDSIPATCFPTASALASSFDRELAREVGVALGEECQQEDVSVLLGPGVNIKRSPLCGRNFEYMSEDPYVSGEIGAALVEGIQSRGVGTSLKHFAANNQEFCRMTGDSVVDERALHEIYLTGFEKVIKKSSPWTVMCSYNKLNGTYNSENKWLLTDLLREDWGYDGMVVSDWGAVINRVNGIKAGMDLEMPGNTGRTQEEIIEAVKCGELQEADLDRVVARIVELVLKAQDNKKTGFRYDQKAHQAVARKAAARSSVLLKNEGNMLPLNPDQSIAVIGAFAKTPRYQGSGSSKINPSKLESVCDALHEEGVIYDYAEGYSLKPDGKSSDERIKEACQAAQNKDVVLLFTGLPDAYETEGNDRSALEMPKSHLKLIESVTAVNPNVVIILQLGAPVEMPWRDKVKAVLLSYLGGQAGGKGCVDILLGKENPGGKLAETWPVQLADVPCAKYFPGGSNSVQYRESIFVGYRYYDTVQKEVAYPFGHGLSYTSFSYTELQFNEKEVSCRITNTGTRAGAEVVQLYIGMENSKIFRAQKELKGFKKVFLEPGESAAVSFTMDNRSFAYYNTAIGNWAVEEGDYTIWVGTSSRDIRLEGSLKMNGDGQEEKLADQKEKLPTYYDLPTGILEIPEAEFTALYGRKLPLLNKTGGKPYTVNSTFYDIKDTMVGKMLFKQMMKQASNVTGDDYGQTEMDESALHIPLRLMVMMNMSEMMVEGLVDMANGHILKGIVKLVKSRKK